MTRFKLLGTTALAVVLSLAAYGQKTLNAAGSSKTLGTTVHEWSVGEMALVQTASNGTLTVTQGVLQPASGTMSAAAPGLQIVGLDVYPNPATERLFLAHHFPQPGTLACQLLDATGKVIQRETYALLSGNGTQMLDLHDMAAGTYLLQIRFTDRSRAESAAVYTIQKTH